MLFGNIFRASNVLYDNQKIEYCIYREEVFGSGINPSIKHCFLAYMENKNKVSFYC